MKSRVQRYRELHDELNKNVDERIENNDLSDFANRLNRIDSQFERMDTTKNFDHTPGHAREVETPIFDTFENEYLKDFLDEVKEYNVRKGYRSQTDTKSNILDELKRRDFEESHYEPTPTRTQRLQSLYEEPKDLYEPSAQTSTDFSSRVGRLEPQFEDVQENDLLFEKPAPQVEELFDVRDEASDTLEDFDLFATNNLNTFKSDFYDEVINNDRKESKLGELEPQIEDVDDLHDFFDSTTFDQTVTPVSSNQPTDFFDQLDIPTEPVKSAPKKNEFDNSRYVNPGLTSQIPIIKSESTQELSRIAQEIQSITQELDISRIHGGSNDGLGKSQQTRIVTYTDDINGRTTPITETASYNVNVSPEAATVSNDIYDNVDEGGMTEKMVRANRLLNTMIVIVLIFIIVLLAVFLREFLMKAS